jgi:hypothetical protein
MCQPNNRIYWRDSNWITNEFPIATSDIKVDDELISVESFSDKWVSSNSDSFYYNIEEVKNK